MGQKILITGTNSGFGTLMVHALLAEGHQVAASMREIETRNTAAAQALRDAGAKIVQIDVTQDDSVEQGVRGATEQLEGLDVLINNAGIGVNGLQESFTPDDFQRLFAINVFGVQLIVLFCALLCGCMHTSSQPAPKQPDRIPKPPPHSPKRPEAQVLEPETSFDQRYPEPRIHNSWKLPTEGLRVIEVFDRSQEAEDPVGTALWIEVPNGKPVRYSQTKLISLVEKYVPAPTTKSAAVALAVLPAICRTYLNSAVIWKPALGPLPGIATKDQPNTTVVTKRIKGGWSVHYFSVVSDHNFFTGDTRRSVYHWEVVLRGSVMSAKQRVIYSENSLEAPRPANKT